MPVNGDHHAEARLGINDDDREAVRLAAAALRAAQAGQNDKAARYVQRINDECGGEGNYMALLAWCDAAASHAAGVPSPPPVRPRIAMVEQTTGRLDRPGSDRVPADVQWAAALIQARAAMDHEQFDAALGLLPADDPVVHGEYVWRLLTTVAMTINGLPYGYGRMGKGASS